MGLPTTLVAAGLAAAAPQTGPVAGPGQVILPIPAPPADRARPEVTVLPAKREETAPAQLDELKDPAETAAAPPTAAPTETAPAPAADAAPDPLEDELAQQIKPDNDPLEGFNRISFSVSMAIDKAILRPLALGFRQVTPKPLRDGMRNMLSNFGEPVVFMNDILQLKPKRAIKTLGRFLLNTLLGIGGLFDVAKNKQFNLPHHSNRISDTLGFYGIKSGPYLYLPIFGPTTLRDQVDRVDGIISGSLFDNPVVRGNRGTAFQVASGLEERAANDQELKALLDNAVDPYATFRTTWLQDRQGEIDRLKAPDGKQPGSVGTTSLDAPLADPLTDPAASPVAKPAEPVKSAP